MPVCSLWSFLQILCVCPNAFVTITQHMPTANIASILHLFKLITQGAPDMDDTGMDPTAVTHDAVMLTTSYV